MAYERRFPIEALEERICVDHDRRRPIEQGGDPTDPRHLNVPELASMCGVDKRTWARWRVSGVGYWQADRAACAAGYHPAEVWPEFVEEAA